MNLAIIYQFLGKFENNISRNLRKKVIERYTRFYNLPIEEAHFFLDLYIESLNDCSNDFALKEGRSFRGDVKNVLITSLNLSGYNYLYLPDSIGNIFILESLDLQSSMFNRLPEEWDRLKNLKVLDLSHNKFLEEIPESLLNLETLEYLDLSYNPILTLPEWVSDLRNLKKLDIKHIMNLEIPQSVILSMKDTLIIQ